MDSTVEILVRKVAKLENEIVKLNTRLSAIEAQHQNYGGNYGGNYGYDNECESDFWKNDGWGSHIAPCPCDSERDW